MFLTEETKRVESKNAKSPAPDQCEYQTKRMEKLNVRAPSVFRRGWGKESLTRFARKRLHNVRMGKCYNRDTTHSNDSEIKNVHNSQVQRNCYNFKNSNNTNKNNNYLEGITKLTLS